MKKNIKKLIFSLAMAVGLALGTAAVCSFADTGEVTVGGIKYSYDTSTHTASVIGDIYFDPDPDPSEKNMNDAPEIEIPSTITVNGDGGYTVTAIGEKAFYLCESLTSITIPNTVTSIGNYAFNFCSSLTSITIPEGVTTIGDNTFDDCENLQSVTLPESLKTIGDRAFSRCSSLQSIMIPEGVTTIGTGVFGNCDGLTSVVFPSTLSCIGNLVFSSCDSLREVYVSEDLESLGNAPFNFTTQDINVWRYSVNYVQDGITHVKITSMAVANGDDDSWREIRSNAMGESYVIDSVECCRVNPLEGGSWMVRPHVLIKNAAVAATCATDGNSAYWSCDRCNKYFSDENGETEIAENSWIIGATGHAWSEVSYTWSQDNSTCTATRVCGNDNSHVETETVTATSAIKTEATCTTAGTTTYTAEFENEAFATQTKDVEDIAATGHNMTAHAAVAATCTEAGNSAYWSCDGCNKYFSDENGETEIAEGDWVIAATGHTFGAEWSKDGDNHWHECTKCGTKKDEAVHDWGVWAPVDETDTHKRTCGTCGAEETADHTWKISEVTKDVTDTEDGELKYICEICGGEKLEIVPALENYVNDPNLEQAVNKDGEAINCIVQDPYKALPEGVRLEIKLAEGERYDELNSQLDPTHPIENVAFFDIKLYAKNEDGVEYELHGLDRKVRVLLQIPEGWDKEDMEAVLIAEDADIEFEEDIVTIDGVDYVAFWTNHFSPYATIDELTEEEARAAAAAKTEESNKEADSTGKSGSVRTGDEINSYIMLEMVLFLAYVSLFVALRRRQKILLNEKK